MRRTRWRPRLWWLLRRWPLQLSTAVIMALTGSALAATAAIGLALVEPHARMYRMSLLSPLTANYAPWPAAGPVGQRLDPAIVAAAARDERARNVTSVPGTSAVVPVDLPLLPQAVAPEGNSGEERIPDTSEVSLVVIAQTPASTRTPTPSKTPSTTVNQGPRPASPTIQRPNSTTVIATSWPSAPPTATQKPPASSAPLTPSAPPATPLPPTSTGAPTVPTTTPSVTVIRPTAIPVPPTSTNTAAPPTATHMPTAVPPTATDPPTPTATRINTAVPPTATHTATAVSPTATETPTPTATHTPTAVPPTATETPTPTATETPTPTAPEPVPLVIQIVVPSDGATVPSPAETNFRAIAYDPEVGTNDGDGITSLDFNIILISGSGNYSHNRSDTDAPYCAYGANSVCPTIPNWDSMAPGTYQLTATAHAAGKPSVMVSVTFTKP